MLLLAATVLASAAINPEHVLHTYWEKLTRAKSIHAKFTIPNAEEQREVVWECRASRPFSLELKGPRYTLTSDGKSAKVKNGGQPIQTRKASPGDIPPPIEPFFGSHRLDAAGWKTLSGKQLVMVFATKMPAQNTSPARIYLDPATALPVAVQYGFDAQAPIGHIRLFVLDEPKRKEKIR